MAKPSKSKVQATSLAFFKAWLEGVEEMQGEDWTPNAEQWRRIREKLMAIEDTPTTREVNLPSPAFYQNPVPQATSAFMPPLHPQPAPGPTPSQKTPDIDSSNGYQSNLI